MNYFDTSFLVPIFVEQAFTERADRVLQRQPTGEATVSLWTRVEFSSAIARQVRVRSMGADSAALIESAFDAYVASSFDVVIPDALDFETARRFIRRYDSGLRSGDALHLAIASNRGADFIYSLDEGLLRAGRMLGLPVHDGGRPG